MIPNLWLAQGESQAHRASKSTKLASFLANLVCSLVLAIHKPEYLAKVAFLKSFFEVKSLGFIYLTILLGSDMVCKTSRYFFQTSITEIIAGTTPQL